MISELVAYGLQNGLIEDADKVYVEQIMPDKIHYNMKYIEHRSVMEYFKIIFLTIWSIGR